MAKRTLTQDAGRILHSTTRTDFPPLSTGDLYGRERDQLPHKRRVWQHPPQRIFAHDPDRITGYQLIRRMRAILQREFAWTQDAEARDGRGRPCSPESLCAVRYSITGIMQREAPQDCNGPARHQVYAVLTRMAGMPLYWFNDNSTHEQVIGLLDRAIDAWDGRVCHG